MDCSICDRSFAQSTGLIKHYQAKHRNAYCGRCERVFSKSKGLEQHLSNSSSHHRCEECLSKPDFPSAEQLLDHRKQCHHYCAPCDRLFAARISLEQHENTVHNVCRDCGRSFDWPDNLRNHERIHAPKNIPCPGCRSKFDRHSAMVLHLEAGSCPSGVNSEDVDDIAKECTQSQHYISTDANFDYCCPQCQVPFTWMSGVLQHAESDACDIGLGRHSQLGKFLHFLRRRI
ncbi:hypothetical protein CTAM01_17223 [Colletotrichum tamarilloi]|uniref:C2H2-type domain-containing protein n=1 Tax=Colletotrichum tamarilloi TaxID=1209934 RepID=A0ABQ9QG98_9PEZI|nr:uncharacterized protein CTAM01_17223 [Colletotrichum tamarilloi]KAK1456214.1 hypothetical protein CTAM01_17223 [Colletotrichum tamarilloi]